MWNLLQIETIYLTSSKVDPILATFHWENISKLKQFHSGGKNKELWNIFWMNYCQNFLEFGGGKIYIIGSICSKFHKNQSTFHSNCGLCAIGIKKPVGTSLTIKGWLKKTLLKVVCLVSNLQPIEVLKSEKITNKIFFCETAQNSQKNQNHYFWPKLDQNWWKWSLAWGMQPKQNNASYTMKGGF